MSNASIADLLDVGAAPAAAVYEGRRGPTIPRGEFLLMRRTLRGMRGQLDVFERELDRLEQFQIEGPTLKRVAG